jgi:general secretion pathway protein K
MVAPLGFGEQAMNIANKARSQHGSALLIALGAVALIASLATASLARQSRLISEEEISRERGQADLLVQGTIDWARLILRQDAQLGGIDHLGEPWSIPISDVSLSDFISMDRSTPFYGQALLSGHIIDAQSRLNYFGLAPQGQPNPAMMAAFDKLASLVGPDASSTSAKLESKRLRRALHGPDSGPDSLLAPMSAAQRGLMPDGKLSPMETYLSYIPGPAALNVNTASPQALSAMIPSLSLSAATTLASGRSSHPFASLDDFTKRLPAGLAPPAQVMALLSVSSSYFILECSVKTEHGTHLARALLRRQGSSVSAISIERGPAYDQATPQATLGASTS